MLGLIARADSRGLGIQTKAFHDNMHPAKTLVVDCPSANPLPVRRDWYPDAQWVNGLPSTHDLETFLDGLTSVYTAETAYSQEYWPLAESRGVTTVLAANFEFLDHRDHPTVWAAPSLWRWDEWPQPKQHLPVPIETSRFTPNLPDVPSRFLHIVGRPAIHDRNGTADLLQALPYITANITLTITCQQTGYVENLLSTHGVHWPINVHLDVRSGDTPNYWDNYIDQHVLVLPRRFGGLCLPANEAVGAGMPVIMPNISPNEWLPDEWLTPAQESGSFRAKQHITYYHTEPHHLAARINAFCNPDVYGRAKQSALRLAKERSWDNLKPLYKQLLR